VKLLVVDDDADMLAVVGFALRQAGFPVVSANSYGTALSTFRTELPDLAILDINLPGGSGFDLCGVLRKESTAPIMMLTARGEEADLVRALELGADDYLTKPFSPRTLVARQGTAATHWPRQQRPDPGRRAVARSGSADAADRRSRDQSHAARVAAVATAAGQCRTGGAYGSTAGTRLGPSRRRRSPAAQAADSSAAAENRR
jgi:DNA-binding response OmpR family regulator